MILVLRDADGRTVAKADISGSLWAVVDNGFVNHDEIRLTMVRRRGLWPPIAGGLPVDGWIEDHNGTRITHMALEHQQRLGCMDEPFFRAGTVTMNLYPLKPPETKS